MSKVVISNVSKSICKSLKNSASVSKCVVKHGKISLLVTNFKVSETSYCCVIFLL